jgi:DNA-binding CsgD family transcriptional regulator
MCNAVTPREWEVLKLVSQGFTNKGIARELGITEGTVKIHMQHIFEKMGTRSRMQLIIMMVTHENQGKGIVQTDTDAMLRATAVLGEPKTTELLP